MSIVYHTRYNEVYALDLAASAGRLESILRELWGNHAFVEPGLAAEEDLARVHTKSHIESVKRDLNLYEIACLAAGGAIMAAQIAVEGEASFGLIRPPGHHASADHCWGFCFFNNIAVALAKLQNGELIKRALILDFDLHYGDGTENIFKGSGIKYFQPEAHGPGFVEEIKAVFDKERNYDILAVSAGFDRHVDDWGGQLTTDDYRTIGELVKEAAMKNCKGRRFAVLEGGYNHIVLGLNVKAFLEGLY